MDEPEINRKDFLFLEPLVDSILDSIQRCLQIFLPEEVQFLLLVMQVFVSEDIGASRITLCLLSYRSLLKN